MYNIHIYTYIYTYIQHLRFRILVKTCQNVGFPWISYCHVLRVALWYYSHLRASRLPVVRR